MKVLFVCSGNIGRSQMAMEFFKKHSGQRADSAGTHVTAGDEAIGGRDDAQVVLEAMREIGIDITNNRRTQLAQAALDSYDQVIVMAEPYKIPDWLRAHPGFVYWETPNVKDMSLAEVREVRDMLEKRVRALLGSSQADHP